jgi:anti-anti-sigma factor
MRVETAHDGRAADVRPDGRLDAERALQLAAALEEMLRDGTRTAVVDLSAVSFASSAGAAAIVRSAREFAAVRGELFVAWPPPLVRLSLEAVGLVGRVLETTEAPDRGRISSALDLRGRQGRLTREWHTPAARAATDTHYETVPRVAGGTLDCHVVGRPVAWGGRPAGGDRHAIQLDEGAFALGLGAIDDGATPSGDGAGELLAAGGVLFHLPTSGAGVPDYLATVAGRPPSAIVEAGIICRGEFSHLVRFRAPPAHPVALSELAHVCLEAAASDAVGLVVVAETAGLVGAWRRPPSTSPAPGIAASNAAASAAHDAATLLREWLSLTAEPAHAGTTTLVVGVAARRADAPLADHLRPLGRAPALRAHLHAAVFPYRPVPQRTIGVTPLVAGLLDQSLGVRAVLHLLDDGRPGRGAGESTFLRGLAWTAPIGRISEEER